MKFTAIGLFTIVILTGCTTNTSSKKDIVEAVAQKNEEETIPNGYKRYTNEEVGFSFLMPKNDWTYQVNEKDGYVAVNTNNLVQTSPSRPPANSFIKVYFKSDDDIIKDLLGNSEIKSESIEVSGIKTSIGEHKTFEGKYFIVTMPEPNKHITFKYSGLEKDVDVFKELINSFTLQ